MSDLEAELARLRAENERLRAEQAPRRDEYAGLLNAGLAAQAASARREASAYQAIQMQGLEASVGEITPTSLDAAERVMRDMGLI